VRRRGVSGSGLLEELIALPTKLPLLELSTMKFAELPDQLLPRWRASGLKAQHPEVLRGKSTDEIESVGSIGAIGTF